MSDISITSHFGHTLLDEDGDEIALIQSEYDPATGKCNHTIKSPGFLSTAEAITLWKALGVVLDQANSLESDDDDGTSDVPAPADPSSPPALAAEATPPPPPDVHAFEKASLTPQDLLLKHAKEAGLTPVSLFPATADAPPAPSYVVTLDDATTAIPRDRLCFFFSDGPNPSWFVPKHPSTPLLIQKPIRGWPLLEFLTFLSSIPNPSETPA